MTFSLARCRARGLVALLFCAAAGLLLAACGAETLERPAVGPLEEVFGPEVRVREKGAFGLDRWSPLHQSASDGPGNAIRVSYPAGSVSPSATREYGAPGGGMQVYLPRAGGALDEAYLRYWLRLPTDFAFVKGGKLPGLFGGSKVSGGEEPDGTDGFSTRLMWRSAGAGEVYLYAPGKAGASLGRGSWRWPTGKWACVEQHVALNEADRDNGKVTVWLDGAQVFEKEDIRYRTVDSLRIEGIFFSTFFGGADRTWASPEDQYADFAGFRISTERVGCDSTDTS